MLDRSEDEDAKCRKKMIRVDEFVEFFRSVRASLVRSRKSMSPNFASVGFQTCNFQSYKVREFAFIARKRNHGGGSIVCFYLIQLILPPLTLFAQG